MKSESNLVNPCLCPLCGQENRCAMEIEQATGEKQAACWCTSAHFSQALLAKIPANARGTACVCATWAKGTPAT